MRDFGLAALLLTLVFHGSVVAEERVSGHRSALLIGNAEYGDFTLKGVGKSLDAVESALSTHGYAVTRQENLDEKELKATVESFARSVPTNGVALVYYVGLAAHVERFGKYDNYLRPVGADISRESDYRSRTQSVSDLMTKLRETSGARFSLVFLDANWDSPLRPEDQKVIGGLREFETAPESAVVFAAPSGKTIAVPESDTPSALALALARHAEKLDDSISAGLAAMTADANDGWLSSSPNAGLGQPSPFPRVDSPDQATVPGTAFVNSVGMSFRWCPPGTFTMGSADSESATTSDRKPVEVKLTEGFWMGEHELTQGEYYTVARRNLPAGFTTHKNAPFWGATEQKSVTEFCKKLTELEHKAGTLPKQWEYDCPTEAQWEYACRAGSTAAYCFGDDVSKLGLYGNFADGTLLETSPDCNWADDRSHDGVGEGLALVGSYRPNGWGIRDMHGNVAELVSDHLLPSLPGGVDPLARVEKDGRTQIRGGAWCSVPLYCESSFRNSLAGRDKLNFVGFRITLKQVK